MQGTMTNMPVVLTQVSINLGDLLNLLLALAGATALIALAVFLFRLAGTVKELSKLVSSLSPNIDETVKKLPSIMDDVNIITGNVVDMTDAAADSVPSLLGDVSTVTGSVTGVVNSVGGLVSNVTDTLGSVVGLVKKPLEQADTLASAVRTAVKVGAAYKASQKRRADRAIQKEKLKAKAKAK